MVRGAGTGLDLRPMPASADQPIDDASHARWQRPAQPRYWHRGTAVWLCKQRINWV